MVFELGELFCGPGGLGLGATSAGIISNSGEEFCVTHKWATDYNKDTCNTYEQNISKGKGKVIHEDIRELNLNKLGEISALAFGFPCNDFSQVGEQKGIEGVFGSLYTYGVSVLNLYQPSWFLAENVGGIRNSNEGNAFRLILRELRDSGYRIYPHLYKFEEYGVPQARHRVIIIGVRNDLPYEFKIPNGNQERIVSAQEALEVPPIPPNASNNEFTNQSQTVIERLSYIKPGENAWTADIPEHLRLNVKGAKLSQIYKRLEADKPSYTITGSGGGGTHVYHWSENRALTNRERARLQTFPDDFTFLGTKESVRKQIGMAVPVLGAKAIVEAVLKTFAGVDYEAVSQNIHFENSTGVLSNEDILVLMNESV